MNALAFEQHNLDAPNIVRPSFIFPQLCIQMRISLSPLIYIPSFLVICALASRLNQTSLIC